MTTSDDKKYFERDTGDTQYGGAKAVVAEEFDHIRKWRGLEPRAGIALSGGGIRSASFGLGILQALTKGGWLREFDYLSTVSGGGYTGASLSYLLHLSRTVQDGTVPKFDVSQENFPYLSYPMVGTHGSGIGKANQEKGALLRRLRQNAKYLIPGNGITIMSLLGVVLRNSFTSIVVHGSVIALALLLLIGVGFLGDSGAPAGSLMPGMNTVLWFSTAMSAAYAALSGLYVVTSGSFDTWFDDDQAYRLRRGYEWTVNVLLWIAIGSFVIGVLPWLYQLVRHWETNYSLYAGAASTVVGVAASAWSFMQSSGVKKPKVPVGLVVAVASVLLLAGFVLMAFWLALSLNKAFNVLPGAALLAILLIAAGWFPSVNYLSVHRYYRDRLMEVFMPDSTDIANPEKPSGETLTGNKAMLGALCGVGKLDDKPDKDRDDKPDKNHGPYHLICANVVLVSSGTPRYRGRGGDSFVFSPLYTGSHATGWAPTNPEPGKGMTLVTAMAISGAAVNPGTGVGGDGVTRQPVLSVLMSMLNIRLGYWLRNPGWHRVAAPWEGTSIGRLILKPNMIYPGMLESLGRRNLREDKRYILLTDGGHFENLGVYELLRRRLKLVVVCDGAADPNYAFADLANALEKARADFGVLVEISAADLDDLVPHTTGKADVNPPMAKRGYLAAPIKYAPKPGSDAGAEENCGLLIYITTTFFKELDASLYGYRKAHPDFPDEPTSDQFFDEKQFESYRELGYQTAWRMMTDFSPADGGPTITLGGVELPRIHKATRCTEVPPPFQDIRQGHRRAEEASRQR